MLPPEPLVKPGGDLRVAPVAAVILVVLARPVGLLGEESGEFPAMSVCAPIEVHNVTSPICSSGALL